MSKLHYSFQVSDGGLFFCPEFPFLGTTRFTPHGVVECDCCGNGILQSTNQNNALSVCLDSIAEDN